MISQWIRRTFGGNGVILMYHRIAKVELDPWGMVVTAEHFKEHLEVLRHMARPIPLAEMGGDEAKGKSVAITFDDGYADNLRGGIPLLDHYDIPATFFIVSGAIGDKRGFWWDELQRLLLAPRSLPPVMELKVDGQCWKLDLGKGKRYYPRDLARDVGRMAWDAPLGSRMSFFYVLWENLRTLSNEKRWEALEKIREWGGLSSVEESPARLLNADEIRMMGQKNLVDIGAHTVSHSWLPACDDSSLRAEIQHGKEELTYLTGKNVTSFSYPHGEYDNHSIDAVKEAGYERACTTMTGTVRKQTDPFKLPRFCVRDWDGDQFAKKLTEWFGY